MRPLRSKLLGVYLHHGILRLVHLFLSGGGRVWGGFVMGGGVLPHAWSMCWAPQPLLWCPLSGGFLLPRCWLHFSPAASSITPPALGCNISQREMLCSGRITEKITIVLANELEAHQGLLLENKSGCLSATPGSSWQKQPPGEAGWGHSCEIRPKNWEGMSW